MCLCLFPHDISKTDAARITKLDVDMFHRESCKLFILGSKDQRARSRGTKTVDVGFHSCECWLLLVNVDDSDYDNDTYMASLMTNSS